MKKYTLKEAFEKGFLWNNDVVDIARLYLPLREIGCAGIAYRGDLRIINMDCVFAEISFSRSDDDRRPKGHVFLNNGEYLVEIAWKLCWRFSNMTGAILVASKFLTIEELGLKATYNRGENSDDYTFNITLPSNILVDFTDEKVPYLELPEHTAYVLPKENL